MSVNYAAAFGIKSLAAPIVFAILYVPLFVFYIARTVAHPSYVFFILALFSAIRITAFVLRALLSHDAAVADNIHALIAYEILYNTGFFGLLYSAYILVTDRVALAKNPPNGPVSRLLRFRFLFRIALMAAVALGITGAVETSLGTQASTISTGTTLRKVAIYIFLVCAVLVLLQTGFLARAELQDGSYRTSSTKIGAIYGVYILLVISTLLVAREAFFTATASKPTQQNNEALWYPLSVVTEFIAVALFAIPGLVPE